MEISRQFFLFCPDFARLRLKHLRSITFGKPEDIAASDVGRLKKFKIGSKRIVDMQKSYDRLNLT